MFSNWQLSNLDPIPQTYIRIFSILQNIFWTELRTDYYRRISVGNQSTEGKWKKSEDLPKIEIVMTFTLIFFYQREKENFFIYYDYFFFHHPLSSFSYLSHLCVSNPEEENIFHTILNGSVDMKIA